MMMRMIVFTALFVCSLVTLSNGDDPAYITVSTDGLIQAGSTIGDATFSPTIPGKYTFRVTANDGCSAYQDEVSYHVRCEAVPVAHAGRHQTKTKNCTSPEAPLITLDGSESHGSYRDDSNQDTLTYAWSFKQVPADSNLLDVNIIGRKSVNATFTPDVLGTYVVSLSVGDCCGEVHDEVVVNYVCNGAPIARGGSDRVIPVGQSVTLDASQSSDPEGNDITFSWKIVSFAHNSNLTQESLAPIASNSQNVTFSPDTTGSFKIELTVSDCCSHSTDVVAILATCTAPPRAAIAGESDVSIGGIQRIVLDGSPSYDLDSQELVYRWRLTSKPSLSEVTTESIVGFNGAFADFTPDLFGNYEVSLEVSDGCRSSTTHKRFVVGCNNGPVARAGKDKSISGVAPFPKVTLDGCTSSDPDSDVLVYKWSVQQRPTGSGDGDAGLSKSDHCHGEFTPPVLGEYVLSLQVSDACSTSYDTVSVLVGCNEIPNANAGPDQTVIKGCRSNGLVTVYGTLSSDPDSDNLKYSWVLADKPAHSELTTDSLVGANNEEVQFVADELGAYSLELTVSDGCSESTDIMKVHYTCSRMPTANPGGDRVETGQIPWIGNVMLDGSKSSDVDSIDLTYSWSFINVPDSSSLALGSDDIAYPSKVIASFVPDVAGLYEIDFDVSDCCSTSSSRLRITVACGAAPQANAGRDQMIVEKCSQMVTTVDLDGTGTKDPDSPELAYKWRFIHTPEGSLLTDASIHNSNHALASFQMPAPSRDTGVDSYVLQLEASDGCNTIRDHVRVTYLCNKSPKANAGQDSLLVMTSPFQTVHLNATLSHDQNGDELTYQWKMVQKPTDSTISIVHDDTSAVANFMPDAHGEYVFDLVVRDCCSSSSDQVKVSISCGTTPKVMAGPDQMRHKKCGEENVIHLDGSATSDADGDSTLDYSWSIVGQPEDSTITDDMIVNGDTAQASVTVSELGDYTFKLTVTDECSALSDEVAIQLLCDRPPWVSAGESENVRLNPPYSSIPLSGSAKNPDGSVELEYDWTIIDKPEGSSLTNSSVSMVASQFGARFTPDHAGCYTLQFEASGCCGSAASTKEVCVDCTQPPQAKAGGNQYVVMDSSGNVRVKLDGCNSTDADGDVLQYEWTFNRVPHDSEMTEDLMYGSGTCNPQFVPDVVGTYDLTLSVSDGCSTDTDMVKVWFTCNNPPTANAGHHRTVTKDCDQAVKIVLDGHLSADVDSEDTLTYEWTIKSVPDNSSITDADLTNSHTIQTYFSPDEFGDYSLLLTVRDACSSSTDEVTIKYLCGAPPYASAGLDQFHEVEGYETIELDSSMTHDLDSDVLSRQWSFVSIPPSSQLRFNDIVGRDQEMAYFLPDTTGVYVLKLTVSDCCSESHDSVKITLKKAGCSQSPVVNAGEDRLIQKECGKPAEVQLDGFDSWDDDSEVLTYQWSITSVPHGSTLQSYEVHHSSMPQASFSPDVLGAYTVQLAVSDGCSTVSDEVTLTYLCNDKPVAVAGPNQNVNDTLFVLPVVTVDGRGSFDRNRDDLSYSWTIVDVPKESNVENNALFPSGNSAAKFLPDVRGCYELELEVADCCSSSTDTVEICITCSETLFANAGMDRALKECEPFPPVKLDGTASGYAFDDEADMAAVQASWTLVKSPPTSALNTSDIQNAHSLTAYLVPDVVGDYELELTVYDGCSTATDRVGLHIDHSAHPPVSNAGSDQFVRWSNTGLARVDLDGENSHDPDGDLIAFEWRFKKLPPASNLLNRDIQNRDQMNAVFWPDCLGTFEVELQVQDCNSVATDYISVVVLCNSSPLVDAGEDQVIQMGCEPTVVQVDATAFDPEEGTSLSYEWDFIHVPPGSSMKKAQIMHSHTLSPSFNPDITEDYYEVMITVSDGCSEAHDSVKISFNCNQPPSVSVGHDMQISKDCTYKTVVIDSVEASDPEDDPLTFQWRFTQVPPESSVKDSDLLHATSARPSFALDTTGIYELEVEVQDCCKRAHDRIRIVYQCGTRPLIISAGDDQNLSFPNNVPLSERVVEITGSLQNPEDHPTASFKWAFVSKPEGSHVHVPTVSDKAVGKFSPDLNGVYELMLTVSDCCSSETAKTKVTISCDDPPRVVAGPDQTFSSGCSSRAVTVQLDGSKSSDPDDEEVTCVWSVTQAPIGSSVNSDSFADKTSKQTSFQPDVIGEYMIGLSCSDGCSTMTDSLVVRNICNDSPVALIAPVPIVKKGCSDQTVTLNATGSSDPDDDDLSFAWSVVSWPQQDTLAAPSLSSPSSVSTDMDLPEVGEYTVMVEVSDCCSVTREYTVVSLRCRVEEALRADAGGRKTIEWDGIAPHSQVLNASLSTTGDGIQYTWEFVSTPLGSALKEGEQIETTSVLSSFVPDTLGSYVVQLTVSDCCRSQSALASFSFDCSSGKQLSAGRDSVLPWKCDPNFELKAMFGEENATSELTSVLWEFVAFNNTDLPSVEAPCEIQGNVGESVKLDGGEQDPTLAYEWFISTIPDGSSVSTTDIVGRKTFGAAKFTPDVAGQYTFKLSGMKADRSNRFLVENSAEIVVVAETPTVVLSSKHGAHQIHDEPNTEDQQHPSLTIISEDPISQNIRSRQGVQGSTAASMFGDVAVIALVALSCNVVVLGTILFVYRKRLSGHQPN